ncbi:hypothetical protein CC85DRAFT_247783 [Cutaneotrichosporon oleaginosum]|uniref:Amino acid transporter transmembrane domain-containing protein n=1 Tax=Cutaneotrichosporon oleaginosum TaxID=879819 RepID=A0A0J0XJT1_9TREE|nr:uncharacterized protein CC85DRAFT_247783 [Cutaneotrichosporon oleaginosum]KLT41353.1 hypothetical protein CC85DRAFT_247783 [Cutaneotrichosporon oleaginosum]
MYYAALERARGDADTRPVPDSPLTVLAKRVTGRSARIVYPDGRRRRLWGSGGSSLPASDEKVGRVGRVERVEGVEERVPSVASAASAEAPVPTLLDVLAPPERETAYRLLRSASWQLVFFLITTDVLGWYTAPMAFAQLGYGPGVLVYTCFWALAFASGQILWRMYLALDSERYPVKCYADLGERTYGTAVRHLFNVLQSLQLVFNTAMLIIMSGSGLAEIIDWKFCYLALNVFFALLGAVLSQIKTIRGLGLFTVIGTAINILVMALTMAGVALYDPVPSQSGHADLSAPRVVAGWVPASRGWYQQVSGCMLAVYAYGGAMIFTEFMAEMRRPRHFWKAALGAQFLCYALYMLFGIFVYSFQGQYTNILPTVNIDSILFQGLTNILGLICITIIAVMYAHIGCKVLYRNVLRGYFGAPSLAAAKSTAYWSALVCAYWAVAWVIGSAIPNIADLNTVIGGACILQFTYTFPAAMLVGHWVQRDAIKGDTQWEPGVQPWSNRIDSWRDASRWRRGFRRYWYAKITLVVFVLGALSLCGLGIYSGVVSAQESFRSGRTTSFSCRAPGQPANK